MEFRKTWFSNVLWAVYTGICIVCLFMAGSHIYKTVICDRYSEVGGLLVFPLAAVVYLSVCFIEKALSETAMNHKKLIAVMEVAAVLMIFAGGILFRVYTIQELADGAIQVAHKKVEGITSAVYQSYYDMAMVRAGENVELLSHTAGYLYVNILTFVLALLGNKEISAIVLQMVIQIITMIFAYFGVRRICGRVAALFPLCYLAFAKTYAVDTLTEIAPGAFIILLYCIILFILISYVTDFCQDKFSEGVAICGAVFSGLCLGIGVYLDISILGLLVMTVALFASAAKKETKSKCLNVFLIVAACGAGFVLAMWFMSLYSGKYSFEQEWVRYVSTQITGCNGAVLYGLQQFRNDFIWGSLIVLFASFLVIEFFRFGKEQKISFWFCFVIVNALTPVTVFGVCINECMPMLIWSVLAGLGLQSCLAEHVCEGAKEAPGEDEVQKDTTALQEAVKLPEKEEKDGSEKEEVQPIKYIKNPLPLPKKHVKKEMDYEYEVDEKDMKYDFEVSDDSEFDIQ